MSQTHALIFGASGVSGWALTKEALQYPSSQSFSKVTALTNRPIDRSDCQWPTDSRLQLASGIDLTGSIPSIVDGLRSKVSGIDTVTHVFFTAYIDVKNNYPELVRVNELLIRNAITAIDQIVGSSSLQAVVLQTGGKHYGVEFKDQVDIMAPLMEDAPRVAKKEIAENIFYYNQYDVLADLSKGKNWRFYEVRPDVIVGFTPTSNFMNVTQGLGFYFSLYRAVHGEGAEVPFVGNPGGWKCKHSDTFQDILAKQEIYIALHSTDVPSGTSFNAANGDVVTWADIWTGLAADFGLKGVGPKGDSPVDVGAFSKEHTSVWKKLEQEHGLKTGIFEKYWWTFIWAVTSAFDFDRQYDLSRSREIGFKEQIKTVDSYITTFDRMRKGKILPSSH